MNKLLIFPMMAALCLSSGCKKSSTPSAKSGDAVQQKLQELAGSGATDCGRLKWQAQEQLKPISDCAMQAAKNKHAFYVAYDLPGMTVAVAGNSEGKLYSVRSEQPENAPAGAPAQVSSAPCPAELRIAESGRTTCFPPGSMGSMGGSPHGDSGMSMPPAGSAPSPHGGGMTMPPSGTPNPHGGAAMPRTPDTGSSSPSKQQ